MDPLEESRKKIEDYAAQNGLDPDDPEVAAAIAEKVDDLEEWLDQKPVWVDIDNVSVG